jgi:hypothetical protein
MDSPVESSTDSYHLGGGAIAHAAHWVDDDTVRHTRTVSSRWP